MSFLRKHSVAENSERREPGPYQLPTADRDTVVAVARRLYANPGFAHVSVLDIAEAAGTAPASVRALFVTDADLFTEVFNEVMAEFGDKIASSLTAEHPLELMHEGVDAWIDGCRDESVRRIVVLDAMSAMGWERFRAEGDQYGRMLIDTLLADAMSRGLIKEQPVKPLASVLAGALEVGVQYAAYEPDPLAALEDVRTALHTVVDGLVGR